MSHVCLFFIVCYSNVLHIMPCHSSSCKCLYWSCYLTVHAILILGGTSRCLSLGIFCSVLYRVFESFVFLKCMFLIKIKKKTAWNYFITHNNQLTMLNPRIMEPTLNNAWPILEKMTHDDRGQCRQCTEVLWERAHQYNVCLEYTACEFFARRVNATSLYDGKGCQVVL